MVLTRDNLSRYLSIFNSHANISKIKGAPTLNGLYPKLVLPKLIISLSLLSSFSMVFFILLESSILIEIL